jgi:hypothetical protein
MPAKRETELDEAPGRAQPTSPQHAAACRGERFFAEPSSAQEMRPVLAAR